MLLAGSPSRPWIAIGSNQHEAFLTGAQQAISFSVGLRDGSIVTAAVGSERTR